MKPAPVPQNDMLRVKELQELSILDTPEETAFNEIVQLAAHICDTPIAIISFVDQDRQWFKAKTGVSATQTPRSISFCGHGIVNESDFFEVPDAREDERFKDNPLVTDEPHVRFYAGIKLMSKNGNALGMLCVNDTKPGKLNPDQIEVMKVLANHVTDLLDLKITKKLSDEKSEKIKTQNEVLKKMISIIAHDIRGPIGSLKHFFELNELNLMDQETKKVLFNMSVTQIDNTLELLNNLVDWGKIQMTGQQVTHQKIKVRELVSDELLALRLTASFKKNSLKNLVSDSLMLTMDADMFRFIIRNLVTNAIKFTCEGDIVVYSDSCNGFHQIIINDSGKGISPESIKKILSDDNLISTNGTDNEKGSGLGLKLIRDFVEKTGGKIDIKSEPGKGTSIILYFPK